MHYGCYLNIFTTFATPEGRNPWVKNAFLAFTHISKSPKFQQKG